MFKSVFPISDFRENSSLEFIEYSIGNWECKCAKLQGLHHLRKPCKNCGHTLIADPYGDKDVLCPKCGTAERGPRRCLRHLRPHRRAQAEVRRRRVPGAGHDLCRAAQGDDPARGLEQGPGDRRQDHPRHQGAGGLLRRHPADDGQRHVHHQRHRAGHRLAAAPLAGRVLPLGRQEPLRRADHPVPRLLGGVRVRRQEPALRPHRPQAQVPRLGVPARPRAARRRRDHPRLLQRGHGVPAQQRPALGGGRQPGRAARPPRRPHRGREHQRGQEDHQGAPRGAAQGRRQGHRGHRRGAAGRLHRRRHRRSQHRRGAARGQRGAHRARDLARPREGRREDRGLLPGARRRRRDPGADAQEGPDPDPRRGADRDLPPPAARRSADARQLAVAVREHVLQPAEVRLLAGRPAEAEHQARARTRRSTRRSCTRRTSTR